MMISIAEAIADRLDVPIAEAREVAQEIETRAQARAWSALASYEFRALSEEFAEYVLERGAI